tara:strand:+ start:461 stop:676 length:216 start_codon:yes stop_codon:yes gene_type:complete
MNNDIYQDMEVRTYGNYVVSVGFDRQWLTYVAQIQEKGGTELYSESGYTKESAFARSIDLIKLLDTSSINS